MNKLRTFFYSFRKSITSPSYYKDVIKAPFSFSLKYTYVLAYFIMLFQAIVIAGYLISQLPKLPTTISSLKQDVRNFYPKKLVITIKDGILTTNMKEPIYFDISQFNDGKIHHFVAIDTKAHAEDYLDNKALILITKDSIVYPETEGEAKGYTVMPISEVEKNKTISNADYQLFANKAVTMLDQVPKIVPLFIILGVVLLPFITAVFIFMRNFVMVGILSVITFLIAAMLQTKLTYKQVFQMGLHAVTIPSLIMIIFFFTDSSIPMLFTSSFLLWMVIILTQYKEVKSE